MSGTGGGAEVVAQGDRVTFLLSQLGHLVVRQLKSALEPLGLHPRQFAILRCLVFSESMTQQALSDRLDVHRSAVVALVDDLEERGLLKRRRNRQDRRAHALVITDLGRDAVVRAELRAQEFEREFLAALSPDEKDLLLPLQRLARAHDLLFDDQMASPLSD